NEAALQRLEVQKRYLEKKLNSLAITSTISGVVTTHNPEEKIGQSVRKGDLIVVVHELETVSAEISVPEQEIANVAAGQRVLLKARAYPEETFVGTVASLAPIANKQAEQPGRRIFLVGTQISNRSRSLKSEMTGNAKIFCGKRRVIDL